MEYPSIVCLCACEQRVRVQQSGGDPHIYIPNKKKVEAGEKKINSSEAFLRNGDRMGCKQLESTP